MLSSYFQAENNLEFVLDAPCEADMRRWLADIQPHITRASPPPPLSDTYARYAFTRLHPSLFVCGW